MPEHNQTAPGRLETVRRFINTWSIPNHTREGTDALPRLVRRPDEWHAQFGAKRSSKLDSLGRLQHLRDDLRSACQGQPNSVDALNNWIARVVWTQVQWTDGVIRLTFESPEKSFTAFIVTSVADSIAAGEWPRLKTCPDCRWAFYDHTRNGSKRWCGMKKGTPDGRACGTIAKVTAYRNRQAGKGRVT